MSAQLGRFLELSVHAPDVLASLEFCIGLGFTPAEVGATWPHPYAVATDGRMTFGLHQSEFASPALTFVLPELRRGVEALDKSGIEFAFTRLGDSVFNEAGFADPDGHMITLLEARTYSPVSLPPGQTSRLGWFEEVMLPVANLDIAQAFWERLGFIALERLEQPWPQVSLTSDTLNLSLVQAPGLGGPTLLFTAADMAARIDALKDAGHEFEKRLPAGLTVGADALLKSREGSRLLLMTRD